MAWRGKVSAIQREEWACDGLKAEGVAVLEDDTRELAPDFDDEGFGHGSPPAGINAGAGDLMTVCGKPAQANRRFMRQTPRRQRRGWGRLWVIANAKWREISVWTTIDVA
jgi:hypothetical protein